MTIHLGSFTAVRDKMYGFLTVMIIVQLVSRSKPGLCDKPTSDNMLSKSLASDVESWLSALDNPVVVVYSGFDVDVPCLENDKDDDSKQTVASNKSHVWYDNDNKTVRQLLYIRYDRTNALD